MAYITTTTSTTRKPKTNMKLPPGTKVRFVGNSDDYYKSPKKNEVVTVKNDRKYDSQKEEGELAKRIIRVSFIHNNTPTERSFPISQLQPLRQENLDLI